MLSKDVDMLSGSIVKGLLSITLPIMIMNVVQSVFNIVDMTVLKTFSGDEYAVGAVGICSTLIALITGLLVGCASGANVVIARYIGRGEKERVERAVGAAILFSAVGGIAIALSAIFSGKLSSIMSSDPAVIAYSRQKMLLISSTYFVCGINEIMGASMRGLGKPLVPTVSTLIFMCGIRFVWVYAIFPLYPNLTFLYLIWPIGWILSIVTVTSFYLPIVKRLGERLSAGKN